MVVFVSFTELEVSSFVKVLKEGFVEGRFFFGETASLILRKTFLNEPSFLVFGWERKLYGMISQGEGV